MLLLIGTMLRCCSECRCQNLNHADTIVLFHHFVFFLPETLGRFTFRYFGERKNYRVTHTHQQTSIGQFSVYFNFSNPCFAMLAKYVTRPQVKGRLKSKCVTSLTAVNRQPVYVKFNTETGLLNGDTFNPVRSHSVKSLRPALLFFISWPTVLIHHPILLAPYKA